MGCLPAAFSGKRYSGRNLFSEHGLRSLMLPAPNLELLKLQIEWCGPFIPGGGVANS